MPRRRVSVTYFWLRLVLPAAAVALGVTWWLNREPAPVSREPAPAVRVPAPAARVPPAATSAPAHSGAVRTAPVTAEQAVRIALNEWAAAWSRRDMAAYAAAYVPEFKGSQPSRQAWLEVRTARIVGRKGLEVTLSDIDVTIDGAVARVKLVQHYRTDTLDQRSTRRLQLRRVGDRWLIEREDGR